MRIFGVDPGSVHTGYGCIDTTGGRHRIVACGALSPPARAPFPERLRFVHEGLAAVIRECGPDAVAIEDLFYARNARSALTLGHVRGAAMLAAAQAELLVAEYAPAEVKRAVVGYGRADKRQVQQMVALLLGLTAPPERFDVTDALAVAICHAHQVGPPSAAAVASAAGSAPRSWRRYRPGPPAGGNR